MSNGKSSSLKRAVDAAFGQENFQKSKPSRRKRSKASRPQQESALEAKSTPSKNHVSDSRDEPPETSQPSNSSQTQTQTQPPPGAATNGTETRDSGGQEGHEHLKKRPRKQQRSSASNWSISTAEGGRFVKHGPILVQKDLYMILAVRTQILVYSTVTSRLVRSLRLDQHEKITSYTTCAANEHNLYVSTYSGLVVKWDWNTGQEIKQWRSSKRLVFISEQLPDQKSTHSSTLLLIHEGPSQTRRVSLATFLDSADEITNDKLVLEEHSLAPWIKVLDQAKCLVAYADNKIFLGQAIRSPEEAATAYTWREIAVPKTITSIDARYHSLSPTSKKKRLAVDIVIGCQNGSILIYDDILFRLMSKEKDPSEDEIVSRRLHWHRNEVLTVKWSLDGNYIISGGHETVMVIWQLDTGQQQFLPHLSATIQHLTVSNTGSAYAVQLADNSVMVLSTSELQPTAFISNLMLRQHRSNEKKPTRIPAILHQSDPTLLALAVPGNHSVGSTAYAKATLLQMYDVQAQRQSHRQALVRNNVTALNVDPSGKPVQEPDVTHLKISHDGKWLATVDEWTPPEHDLKPMHPMNDEFTSPAKEIFLKFWAKNESTRSWELVTKIESPHSMRTTSGSSILDLEANSQHPEFSSISSDGHICIWTPKSRHRNGLPVTDKVGSPLYTWTCTHAIEIPNPLKKLTPTSSALAYSPDGSVLAASSNKSPFIRFIDPLTGNVQHTQDGSHPGIFSHVTFLKHHLVTISKDLRVYNSVSGELLYALALSSSVSDVHLAANQLDQTFAVVCLLPAFMNKEKGNKAKTKAQSQIMVFNLKSATPIFKKIVDGTVEILLSLPGESGYLIINDEAEMAYLRQPGSSVVRRKDLELPASEESTRITVGLGDILGRRNIEEGGDAGKVITDVEEDGSGRIMLTHKKQASLTDVFSNHSTNLPVRELFEQVVAVLSRSEV